MWLLVIIAMNVATYTPVQFMHPKECEAKLQEIVETYPQAKDRLECVALI